MNTATVRISGRPETPSATGLLNSGSALFSIADFMKRTVLSYSDHIKARFDAGTFEALVCWPFDKSGETVMTKFGTIGAACLAAALATASPAFAGSGHGAGSHGSGVRGGSAHFAGGGFRRGGGGFGPGIAAGLIAGAAIGSYGYYGPGYYDDSYAYDNGDNGAYDNGYGGAYDNGYAARNGFVCQPGTVFRGEDGRPHLCQ